MLNDKIVTLGDQQAVWVLRAIADANRSQRVDSVRDLTAESRAALVQFVGDLSAAIPKQVSEGDLARSALLALAEDPEYATVVQSNLLERSTEGEESAIVILSVGLVLVLLQMRGEFLYEDGRIVGFKLSKPSLNGKNLVDLAGKLLNWSLPSEKAPKSKVHRDA